MQFACKLDLHALEQELGFRPAGRRERGEGSRGGSRYRACNCPISLAASGCSTASSASAAAVARSWADPLASRPSSTTHSSSATGGTASDRWVDVTQQREHDVRRQMRAEPDGSGHRDGKCRPLYPATPDDPFHASRGLRASDCGKRLEGKPASSGFGRQQVPVGQPRRRDCCQQCGVVEFGRHGTRHSHGWWRRHCRSHARSGKQVELSIRHERTLPRQFRCASRTRQSSREPSRGGNPVGGSITAPRLPGRLGG